MITIRVMKDKRITLYFQSVEKKSFFRSKRFKIFGIEMLPYLLFRWTAIVLIVLSSIHFSKCQKPTEYVKDPEKLTQLFLLLHPNLNTTLEWKEVAEVSSDTLKIICDSVARELYKNMEHIEYVKEILEEGGSKKSRRILKSEILALGYESVVPAQVAKCVYENVTFYLARASSDAVFVLTRDNQIFRLHSGLYNIKFK